MRMRKKPNLEPRMERCADLLVTQPETLRGQWKTRLADCREVHLELGCGKGRFTCGTAALEPGAYCCDVQLSDQDGNVATLYGPADFWLGGDVSDL